MGAASGNDLHHFGMALSRPRHLDYERVRTLKNVASATRACRDRQGFPPPSPEFQAYTSLHNELGC